MFSLINRAFFFVRTNFNAVAILIFPYSRESAGHVPDARTDSPISHHKPIGICPLKCYFNSIATTQAPAERRVK
jgi:hypothetical protein